MKVLLFTALVLTAHPVWADQNVKAESIVAFDPNAFSVTYRLPEKSEAKAPARTVPAYHGPVMIITGPRPKGEVSVGFSFPRLAGIPCDSYLRNLYKPSQEDILRDQSNNL